MIMLKEKTTLDSSAKYRLGLENFKNWSEVIARAKAILAKGARTLKGRDLKFAVDLLSYHPSYEAKTRDGVKGIKVDAPAFGSYFCFVVVDDNGNEQDFSYKKCTPTGKQNKEKANKSIQLNLRLKCYREAIQPQILEHWESITNKKCCICKTRFSLQVDHKTKSFVTLVSEFEAFYKPDKYPTMERCDSIQTIRFKRSKSEYVKFICEWQKFHRKNADFQLLCSTCNLKKQDGSRYKSYV